MARKAAARTKKATKHADRQTRADAVAKKRKKDKLVQKNRAAKKAESKKIEKVERTVVELAPPSPMDFGAMTTAFPENSIDYDPNNIRTAQELMIALEDQWHPYPHLVLAEEIFTDADIVISRDVVLDLNGHNIIATRNGSQVLKIKGGNVTITGGGKPSKIFAEAPDSLALRIYGSSNALVTSHVSVTIDEDVTLFASDSYGILIRANVNASYGVEVNLRGHIIAREGIVLHENILNLQGAPVINLIDGATIAAEWSAIRSDGQGTWHIGHVELTGNYGLSLRAGDVNLSNTTITTSGLLPLEPAQPAVLPEPSNLALTSSTSSRSAQTPVLLNPSHLAQTSDPTRSFVSPDPSGSKRVSDLVQSSDLAQFANFSPSASQSLGGAIKIENHPQYINTVSIHIDGGTYISQDGYVIFETNCGAAQHFTLRDLTILAGKFSGARGIFNTDFGSLAQIEDAELLEQQSNEHSIITPESIRENSKYSANEFNENPIVTSEPSSLNHQSAITEPNERPVVIPDFNLDFPSSCPSVHESTPSSYTKREQMQQLVRSPVHESTPLSCSDEPSAQPSVDPSGFANDSQNNFAPSMAESSTSLNARESSDAPNQSNLPNSLESANLSKLVVPLSSSSSSRIPNLADFTNPSNFANETGSFASYQNSSNFGEYATATNNKISASNNVPTNDKTPEFQPEIRPEPTVVPSEFDLAPVVIESPTSFIPSSAVSVDPDLTPIEDALFSDSPESATTSLADYEFYGEPDFAKQNIVAVHSELILEQNSESTNLSQAANRLSTELEDLKANLSGLISTAQGLKAEDYAAGFEELQTAMQAASRTYFDRSSTSESFYAAISALKNALSNLVSWSRNTSSEYNRSGANISPLYLQDEDLAAASFELNNYITNCQTPPKPVDFTSLEQLVAHVSSLSAGNYSEASYRKLLVALSNAYTTLGDPEITQAMVNEIIFQLEIALRALEPASQELSQRTVSSHHKPTRPTFLTSLKAGFLAYRQSRHLVDGI